MRLENITVSLRDSRVGCLSVHAELRDGPVRIRLNTDGCEVSDLTVWEVLDHELGEIVRLLGAMGIEESVIVDHVHRTLYDPEKYLAV